MTDTSKYDALVARLRIVGDAVEVPHHPDVAAELLTFDIAQARMAEARAAGRGHPPRPADVPEFVAGAVPPTQ